MREFSFRHSGINGTSGGIVLGIVMILVGLFAITISGTGGIMIGAGIVFLGVSMWKKDRTLIILHDDHLEMKAAPVAPRHQILYQDITNIDDVKGPKKVFLVMASKRVPLPVVALEPSEQPRLLNELRKRIQQAHLTTTPR